MAFSGNQWYNIVMNKRFDSSRRDRLHSDARHLLLPPEKTLTHLGLMAGDHVVDIGCGTGFFAIPASRIVGPEGSVIAIDPSMEMLEDLKRRALEAGVKVRVRGGRAGQIPLPDAGATFAIMANVLHEVDSPQLTLNEVHRILAPGGRVAIVEWRIDYPGGGPPPEHRLPPDRIRALLTEAGFTSVRESNAGEAHTAMIATRGE